MSQTNSGGGVPPIMSKAITFILRSPLHRILSKYLLLISFTGRKSGKLYTTPVSYSQEGNLVSIFTHANWWKNLIGDGTVTLRIQGRDLQGIANPIAQDKQAVARGLLAHLKKAPFDARFYNVSLDEQGNPSEEDIAQAAQTVVMIQVQLPELFSQHATA